MAESDHRGHLKDQLLQLAFWVFAIKIILRVLNILRGPVQHRNDHPMRSVFCAALCVAMAEYLAAKSGDHSVLLLAVTVLGPLIALQPIEEE